MNILKKIFLAFVCLLPCSTHSTHPALSIAVTGLSLATIYTAYRWFHSPEDYKPTLENMNTLTFRPNPDIDFSAAVPIDHLIEKINLDRAPQKTHIVINNKLYTAHNGIEITPEDKTVFIYSRGYAKTNTLGENDNFVQRGAGAKVGHILLNDNIITDCPLITFDYPDHRRCFSFGQSLDITCLETIYTETKNKNPAIDIILIGDCRGGKTALEFVVAKKPENLRALIIMAPFISARDLTYQIAETHLSYLPFSKQLLHTFFRVYFPAYDEQKDNLFERLDVIPKNLPIFVGHRTRDTLVANETIDRLVSKLQSSGNRVYLVTTDDTSEPHSKLTSNKEIQRSINLFLREHNLPHNGALITPLS